MSLTNKPEIICTWRDKYFGEDKTILQVIDEAIIDNTIPYTQEGIDSIIWHCDDFVANEDKKSKLTLYHEYADSGLADRSEPAVRIPYNLPLNSLMDDDIVVNKEVCKLIRALNILEVTYIIYKIVNIETVMKTVKLEFIYK